MSAETVKFNKASLAIILAGILATTASAQDIQSPDAPGAAGAQIQVTKVDGQPFVVGAPVEPTDEKGRKYRDPSTPLTIGEMAEVQKEKAIADFLKKAGYTTVKPPEPPKPEAPKPPERVESKLSVKSVFVREGEQPFAEIETASGALVKATVGTQVGKRITLHAVDGKQVALSIQPEQRSDCRGVSRAAKRKSASCDLTPMLVFLTAGDQYTWFD